MCKSTDTDLLDNSTLMCFSQRKHMDASSSSSSWHCSEGVFLALTVPKAMGIWRGGCRPGSKSILYSCLSQRAVSGSLFHGATLSMLETTRQWNSRLDSFLERRDTCTSLLEEWGCCHAHSNWHTETWQSHSHSGQCPAWMELAKY